MPKNIVICLDGTGNQLKARGNTNVVRVFEMLDLSDPTRQIGYYDPGVGTFSAAAAWTPLARRLSRLSGLAFGSGLRTNLAEAYTFLMQHYSAGDRVYLFGFSRGAFTARALTGLLRLVGLLRPGAENLVPYAVGLYSRSRDLSREDWEQVHHFAGSFARSIGGGTGVPIEYVGIWDSVKAAGFLRWSVHWPFTRDLDKVAGIRHAVSIDEKRRPYHEYLVTRSERGVQSLEELWFAGVHSDVGGGFEDGHPLSRISLKWIVDGAVTAGLLVDQASYRTACAVTAANADGPVHRMGRIWALLTYRRRPIPPGAQVHASVRQRADYGSHYQSRIPADVTWAEPGWLPA